MEKVEARELEYWMGRKTELEKELKRAKGVRLRMLLGLPSMDSSKRQKSQDTIKKAFNAVDAEIPETERALWRAKWRIELLTGDSLLTVEERAAAHDYDAQNKTLVSQDAAKDGKPVPTEKKPARPEVKQKEAAELCHVSVRTIQRWLKNPGAAPSGFPGLTRRISLMQWIESEWRNEVVSEAYKGRGRPKKAHTSARYNQDFEQHNRAHS